MQVKMGWAVAPILLSLSASVLAAESTNQLKYDYLYADLSAGSLNENLGVNNNVTALSIGGNYLLSEHVLATLDYTARFIHPDDITSELYTLLPGVAYRYPLMDKLDIVATAKLGYLWATQTRDSTDEELFKDNEFMWGASLELKYALNKSWELAMKGELNHSDLIEEGIFNLRADYQFSSRMSVGGFYTHRDGDFETSQISGNATTNEGGISLRYLF
ncbi:porin family protein [Vibrio sp. RE86]|uniref:outer membrane beta-barrel protein n=1 Tax=Vibrio sp. RE86 TaxID=2607605 RepID=UPI0014932A67|nr:outer membrane beta-barrel protein [Vibrio sp. RE86]NOH80555.1 porin family protein [Vibrio sp. RE86]